MPTAITRAIIQYKLTVLGPLVKKHNLKIEQQREGSKRIRVILSPKNGWGTERVFRKIPFDLDRVRLVKASSSEGGWLLVRLPKDTKPKELSAWQTNGRKIMVPISFLKK